MGVRGDFVIPNDPQELWDDDSDKVTLKVNQHMEFSNSNELCKICEEVSYSLCGDNPLCVCEQDTFDGLSNVVKRWDLLPGAGRMQLVDALGSSMLCLAAWMDNVLSSPEETEDWRNLVGEYRSSLKVYIFFMQWISKVSSREAISNVNAAAMGASGRGGRRLKKSDDGWDWAEQAGKILKSVSGAMSLDLWTVFRPERPDDALLVSLIDISSNCISVAGCVKSEESVKYGAHILGLAGLRYQKLEAVSSALVELLNQYEHTPIVVAEILRHSVAEWDDGRLAAAVIQEISSADPAEYERQQTATGEKAGVRSIASFVDEVSNKLPKLMATQIALLLPHLGGKAWSLRSGIVSALGHLLAKAFEPNAESKEDQGAVMARLRSKQHLLDILCERIRDQSSYTRKAVLQTWQYLAEQRAIPLGHWLVVTTIATGRLEDKSSLVRKEAMRLIGYLMLHNPFGPSLPLDRFTASLTMHSNMLDQVMPGIHVPEDQKKDVKGSEPMQVEASEDPDVAQVKEEPMNQEEPVEDEARVVMTPDMQPQKTPAEVGWDGTIEELQALVASLELAVDFAKCLTACMPNLVNLLASSTASDVQDSIALLLTCKQFEVVGAPEAIRKMLSLIFSRDQAVKDKVTEALDQLYLTGWAGNSFTSAQAAQNLINLATGATLGELGSLEEVIRCFANKGLITSITVHELWDLAEQKSREIHESTDHRARSLKQLRGALAVLSMAADVIPETVAPSRIKGLLEIAFQRACNDALTVRHACLTLSKVADFPSQKYANVREGTYVSLVGVIVGSEIPDGAWFTAAEAAINTIYGLHPAPESLCCAIIRKMAQVTFSERDQDTNPPPARLASKLFFIVGQIALKHLVLIERCARNVRKARLDAERKAAEASANQSGKKDEDINAELGVGGVAADAELDATKEAAEKQIIGFKNSIIAPFAKIIISTCRQASFLTAEPTLKASALLALTKLMVVDATICENNLQLLFTFLQNRVVDPSIRSNLVVALGDLALRFPNLIEPWTEHVYRPLSDPDVGVRKTSMMVLTHLILNDMMKVKGHIAKMAVCLEDSDERVAALASLFFHELAKKEYKGTSPIYNLLPDMLSMLSKDSTLNRSQFQSVMQQLLAHIKKDKQGDALVEKLCQRFASTEDESQWRNVAFCISQLPMSDKGIKKMVEGFNFYKNALADEETAEILLTIVAKAKKNASKPESKEIVEDLESKIKDCIEEWDEINGTSRKVEDQEKPECLDESVIEGMDRLGLEEHGENMDSNDGNTVSSHKGGRKSLSEHISGKENQRVNKDETDDSNLIAAVQAMAVD